MLRVVVHFATRKCNNLSKKKYKIKIKRYIVCHDNFSMKFTYVLTHKNKLKRLCIAIVNCYSNKHQFYYVLKELKKKMLAKL